MTVYFTSDLHLGHAMVAGLRGFESVDEHDEAIYDRWASTVKKDDLVWVLGDLTLAKPEKVCPRLHTLPGRKRLILGNHDRGHPVHRDAHRWASVYGIAFEWVSTAARQKVCGTEVLLSHFPYSADHTDEPRYQQWRLPDLGVPLLHGHTHSPDIQNGHEVHVGLDAWDGALVRDDTIAGLLTDPSGKDRS